MLSVTETNASYERTVVKDSFGNHLYISMFFFFQFLFFSLFYPTPPTPATTEQVWQLIISFQAGLTDVRDISDYKIHLQVIF